MSEARWARVRMARILTRIFAARRRLGMPLDEMSRRIDEHLGRTATHHLYTPEEGAASADIDRLLPLANSLELDVLRSGAPSRSMYGP